MSAKFWFYSSRVVHLNSCEEMVYNAGFRAWGGLHLSEGEEGFVDLSRLFQRDALALCVFQPLAASKVYKCDLAVPGRNVAWIKAGNTIWQQGDQRLVCAGECDRM